MRRCIAIVIVAGGLAACGTSDETTVGTSGQCAHGGVLNDCPDAERTAQGACWRLVECGAIAIKSDNVNRFTWARCVDTLDGVTADRRRLVINCIAASACDELRVPGSPSTPNTDQLRCLRFGGL
jgi:hypothetical protein